MYNSPNRQAETRCNSPSSDDVGSNQQSMDVCNPGTDNDNGSGQQTTDAATDQVVTRFLQLQLPLKLQWATLARNRLSGLASSPIGGNNKQQSAPASEIRRMLEAAGVPSSDRPSTVVVQGKETTQGSNKLPNSSGKKLTLAVQKIREQAGANKRNPAKLKIATTVSAGISSTTLTNNKNKGSTSKKSSRLFTIRKRASSYCRRRSTNFVLHNRHHKEPIWIAETLMRPPVTPPTPPRPPIKDEQVTSNKLLSPSLGALSEFINRATVQIEASPLCVENLKIPDWMPTAAIFNHWNRMEEQLLQNQFQLQENPRQIPYPPPLLPGISPQYTPAWFPNSGLLQPYCDFNELLQHQAYGLQSPTQFSADGSALSPVSSHSSGCSPIPMVPFLPCENEVTSFSAAAAAALPDVPSLSGNDVQEYLEALNSTSPAVSYHSDQGDQELFDGQLMQPEHAFSFTPEDEFTKEPIWCGEETNLTPHDMMVACNFMCSPDNDQTTNACESINDFDWLSSSMDSSHVSSGDSSLVSSPASSAYSSQQRQPFDFSFFTDDC